MKLGWTILYVPDVQKTVDFYEKAFGLTCKFIHESGQYAEIDTGSTTLAFTANELAQSNFEITYTAASSTNSPAAFELAFTTENVQESYEKALAAGASNVLKPTQKPWGQITSYVRDLNGVLVSISTQIEN